MRAIAELLEKPPSFDQKYFKIQLRNPATYDIWKTAYLHPQVPFEELRKANLQGVYATITGMGFMGSCAAYLLGNLRISDNLGSLEEKARIVAHLVRFLHPQVASGLSQQNLFYLVRDKRDKQPQKDVIDILEKLGFEQVKGSQMKNPVHDSKLSIYARLVK